MKVIYPLFSLLLLLTISSCNQQPRHPQADFIRQTSATAMTDETIARYADSVDTHIEGLQKENSLVYQFKGQSMYAERYSWNGRAVLYEEYGGNGPSNSRSKKYYFKNDSLILVRDKSIVTANDVSTFNDTQVFMRNNIAFKKENRTAASATELTAKPYHNLKASESVSGDSFYAQQITLLDQAINGSNQFEMVFDNIIDGADEKVIQLKGKLQTGYTANVVVKETDAFIESLVKEPSKFRNEKLNFKWAIVDKEAVYVPVASNVTSAKGLKR